MWVLHWQYDVSHFCGLVAGNVNRSYALLCTVVLLGLLFFSQLCFVPYFILWFIGTRKCMFTVSVRIHVKVFVYVVVAHRAIGLLKVLVTSPCRGGAAEIYNWHYYVPSLQERLSFHTVLDLSLCRIARWGILHPSFRMMWNIGFSYIT